MTLEERNNYLVKTPAQYFILYVWRAFPHFKSSGALSKWGQYSLATRIAFFKTLCLIEGMDADEMITALKAGVKCEKKDCQLGGSQ